MITIPLKREDEAIADFESWYFDDSMDLFKPGINKMLNNYLSVVFSGDNANARLDIDGDLQIECVIEIDMDEVYASAKVPLRKLILDVVDCYDGPEIQKMAHELRDIADFIDHNFGEDHE